MQAFIKLSQQTKEALSRNWGWFFGWGILLIILGILAIAYSEHTTIISVIILGTLLVAGGIIIIFDTFQFWWRQWSGFFIHLLTGLLYVIVGAMLIKGPIIASLSITLLLAIFFIFLGAFRIIYALSMELVQRGLRILNGVINVLLGILILSSWPASGLFVIGLFIGIDLLFVGLLYVISALSARALLK